MTVQPATGFHVASVHSIEVSAIDSKPHRCLPANIANGIPELLRKLMRAHKYQPVKSLVGWASDQFNTSRGCRTGLADFTQPVFEQRGSQRSDRLTQVDLIAPARCKFVKHAAWPAVFIKITLKVLNANVDQHV